MKNLLDLGLKNKVAIIAGGGAFKDEIGNGRATSILLAEAGAKVLVVDIDEESAKRTSEMINDRGGLGISIGADLTNSNECKKVINFVTAKWSRLDILDNNIGIASTLSVVNETLKIFDSFWHSHCVCNKFITPITLDQ